MDPPAGPNAGTPRDADAPPAGDAPPASLPLPVIAYAAPRKGLTANHLDATKAAAAFLGGGLVATAVSAVVLALVTHGVPGGSNLVEEVFGGVLFLTLFSVAGSALLLAILVVLKGASAFPARRYRLLVAAGCGAAFAGLLIMTLVVGTWCWMAFVFLLLLPMALLIGVRVAPPSNR